MHNSRSGRHFVVLVVITEVVDSDFGFLRIQVLQRELRTGFGLLIDLTIYLNRTP